MFFKTLFTLALLALTFTFTHSGADAAPAVLGDTICVAQFDTLGGGGGASATACGGCVYSFDAGGLSSLDCESGCVFYYDYTITCPSGLNSSSGIYNVPCGQGGEVSFDCGDGIPFAGARGFCKPCDL